MTRTRVLAATILAAGVALIAQPADGRAMCNGPNPSNQPAYCTSTTTEPDEPTTTTVPAESPTTRVYECGDHDYGNPEDGDCNLAPEPAAEPVPPSSLPHTGRTTIPLGALGVFLVLVGATFAVNWRRASR